MTVLIVGLTSIGVVGLGIVSAYGAVIVVLQGVSHHSSSAGVGSLTLIAGESQAGGD